MFPIILHSRLLLDSSWCCSPSPHTFLHPCIPVSFFFGVVINYCWFPANWSYPVTAGTERVLVVLGGGEISKVSVLLFVCSQSSAQAGSLLWESKSELKDRVKPATLLKHLMCVLTAALLCFLTANNQVSCLMWLLCPRPRGVGVCVCGCVFFFGLTKWLVEQCLWQRHEIVRTYTPLATGDTQSVWTAAKKQ